MPKTCSASHTCVNAVGGYVYSDGYAYCGQGPSDIAANCGAQTCAGSTYYCTTGATGKLWRLTKPAEICSDGIDNDCDGKIDAAYPEIECCSNADCTNPLKPRCDTRADIAEEIRSARA